MAAALLRVCRLDLEAAMAGMDDLSPYNMHGGLVRCANRPLYHRRLRWTV